MDPVPSASLLLVVAPEAALRLRLDWRERAGYKVSPAVSLKDVELACHAQAFDIILVADAVEPRMKKAIGLTVRHFFPLAPILQMGRIRPDIDGDCFVTGDCREDLLSSGKKMHQNNDDITHAP